MAEPIEETLDDYPLTDKDKNVLYLLLGDKTCKDDFFTLLLWYALAPVLLTVAFALLLYAYHKELAKKLVKNKKGQVAVYIVIFLLIALAIEYFTSRWKLKTPLCRME